MESEIKIKVEDLEKVRKTLESLNATLLKKFEQEDVYFSPPNKNFAGTLKYYLRVRSGKNNSFDYHVAHGDVDTDETEVEIENPDKLKEILSKLDFKEDCTVKKIREEYELGKFKIVLDQIEELGFFVEIETDDGEEYELIQTAKKIGLDNTNKVSGLGYPDMIMKLKVGERSK